VEKHVVVVVVVVVVRYGFIELETTPSLCVSYLLNILKVTQAGVGLNPGMVILLS